jgi:pyridinium-3,5-biscarboxylic acid mononucleotide sulfurtransferase
LNISKQKLNNLEQWFEKHNQKVIIAISGGVDSSLVAFLSRKYLGKENTLAVISASPSLKQIDLVSAKSFCEENDINLEIIETKEIEDPNYYSNPINRCYFCKMNLYNELKIIADRYPGAIIINGQNYDDIADYRPGIKAANEFQVLTPLADCKLTKSDIRFIASHFNLSLWDKPASPCLSSRIPYGEEVTVQKLKKIEAAENLLNKFGFSEVRVRNYNNTARIEVPAERIKDLIKVKKDVSNKILQIGFSNCEIDDEGFISGKLNRVLT